MDVKRAFLVCVVVFGIFSSGDAQSTESTVDEYEKQMSNIQKLKDKLFKDQNYDRNVRPVLHHSNTTSVKLSMAPINLVDLNEEWSMLILDTWLVLFWTDFRLAWDPAEFDGLDHLNLPDSFIWQPDIRVYNSHSWNMDPKGSTHLLVYSTGDVWFVPPAVTTTYCSTEPVAGAYPTETVECDIRMGSWSHDGWQIDLDILQEEMYMDELRNNNPRWEVLVDQVNISREIKHYNCCEEPYITVNAKFPLRRRYPPELEVIWSPCILVMTLTLAMFWIPADSGKKFILGPILFLVLVVLTGYAASATRSPRFPFSAVSFLSSTMYAVVSAIVLEVVVINISHLSGPSRPPDFLVNLLSGSILKNVVLYSRQLDRIAGDKIQLKEDTDQVVIRSPAKEEWMLIASALDRFLFVTYTIVFAAIHRS